MIFIRLQRARRLRLLPRGAGAERVANVGVTGPVAAYLFDEAEAALR